MESLNNTKRKTSPSGANKALKPTSFQGALLNTTAKFIGTGGSKKIF